VREVTDTRYSRRTSWVFRERSCFSFSKMRATKQTTARVASKRGAACGHRGVFKGPGPRCRTKLVTSGRGAHGTAHCSQGLRCRRAKNTEATRPHTCPRPSPSMSAKRTVNPYLAGRQPSSWRK
jgi:hypothetical protein